MKKIHNTRGKTEETLTIACTATLEAASIKDDIIEDILKIMEREKATENKQKELETNDFCKKNPMAIGVEGSGNLYYKRSGD
ncbi:42377_t:CDS:2, partial [Gigaspora margarita]